jgi:hypothetical protein
MSYKDNKLPLEDVLNFLSDDYKITVQNFIAYLKEIKLTPRWYATNGFKIMYKGRTVFRFTIYRNKNMSLFFTVADKCDLDEVIGNVSEEMQKFYFKNLRRCVQCNPSHGRGLIINILNQEYGVCAEPEMRFDNPTEEQFDYIKKFIEVRKNNIKKYKS